MPRQSIVIDEHHQLRPRRGAAYVYAGDPPVGVQRVQYTPRLLGVAEFLDRVKCGIAKRLGVAVGERSSRGGRRLG